MRIAVLGAGYVGLVSGVCLAVKGHDVTCVEIDPFIVERLNAGIPTIHENDLAARLKEVLNGRRFRATTDLEAGLKDVYLAIVAVGTPSRDGVIDLSYVLASVREIGQHLKKQRRYLSIVIKSTVVPGTTDSVIREELEKSSRMKLGEFGLGMNPEFLREGNAVGDFLDPDRIVLGFEDEKTLSALEELYQPWDSDKMRVNTRTAEMIKYANNAFLATQISTANEIANLAAELGGIDAMDVMRGVHLDKRWNPIREGRRVFPVVLTYLIPGCGFGGSCFPKDVQALRSHGEQLGVPMRIMNAVLAVNELQPSQVVRILKREIGALEGRKVVVLGLAFKPGTDDARESASLKIVEALVNEGSEVAVHDPAAGGNFSRLSSSLSDRIVYLGNWESSIASAEIVIVATSWPEYAPLAHMDLHGKVLFDARRMFRPGDVGGAHYLTIGRRMTA